MENENVESQDLPETPEEVTTSQETVTTDEATESAIDWEAKAKELEATNKQLYARAKKAEAKPETKAPAIEGDLSGKDVLALSNAGINDEQDIELVQRAAKLNNVSIASALKDPVVSGILKGKQEERQTSQASSSSTRRTATERTPADILAKANKGTMPDMADADKYVSAVLSNQRR